jgi:cellulose synthase/poly-beta-1,6-N-acetylglucosamine synthase-like glycosyltransferase
MLNITVAICTYNSATRLPNVLECLARQTHNSQITWEIIIVDNNSTDNTREIVELYQSRWAEGFLRYVHEPQQGLAFARHRAIASAQGVLVGFLDDDNLPTETWLASAFAFAQTHPRAGAYGGQIHPQFETAPAAEFKPLAIYLAIVERGNQSYLYTVKKRVLPPGAGIVVRRQVWLDHVPPSPRLVGRVGKSLVASEDIEVLAHIQNAGWDIWYNPDMHLNHQIPAWRLERGYLLKLVGSVGLAKHHIRMIRIQPWQRPLAFLVYFTSDLYRWASYWLKHRQLITSNVANACEMQLLTSTIISPFYLLRLAKRPPS